MEVIEKIGAYTRFKDGRVVKAKNGKKICVPETLLKPYPRVPSKHLDCQIINVYVTKEGEIFSSDAQNLRDVLYEKMCKIVEAERKAQAAKYLRIQKKKLLKMRRTYYRQQTRTYAKWAGRPLPIIVEFQRDE